MLVEFVVITGIENFMANNLAPIHPELHVVWKKFPRLSFNGWNVRLFQWLTKLQPKQKAPANLQVEDIYIQSQDGQHSIRLRVYKPKPITTPVPVLAWMHGGGFIIGAPEQNDLYSFELVSELGIVVVSIDYRLAPQNPFPTPLEDCYAALKWIHSHPQLLGIDPQRIAVGGVSAGGGLAANLAQMAHDRGEVPIVFQLLTYPMLDDRTALRTAIPHTELMTWDQKSNRFGWECYLHQAVGLENAPPYAVAARRENFVGLPPAWMGVGTLDLFHDEDIAYAQKLSEARIDCEVMVILGAFHGFDAFDDDLPIIRDFRKSQMTALKKYLFA